LFLNRANKVEPVAAQVQDGHSDEVTLSPSESTHALFGDSDKEIGDSDKEIDDPQAEHSEYQILSMFVDFQC
jgi:hypothetical protein